MGAQILPPAVAALAQRAFGPGIGDPAQRPSAAQWHEALRAEWAAARTCNRRPHHSYGAHLGECPWCVRVTTGKSDPFNPTAPAAIKKGNAIPAIVWVLLSLLVLLIFIVAVVVSAH
jgi:DNA-binding helix-hairpin-helix protein with protein kinase domain